MGQTISNYLYSDKKPYNWKRGLNNPLHKFISFSYNTQQNKIDLTRLMKFPPIYDQQTIGSCTANAICAVYGFDLLNNFKFPSSSLKESFFPSRLYLYYKEREKETKNKIEDKGAVISDGINILQDNGVCSEEKWPYDISNVNIKPSTECDIEAKNHCSIEHRRVAQKLEDIKNCISNNFPIVFGFDVFESFENLSENNNFIVSFPQINEKQLGGHAVVIVGFNDETKLFKIRNSWGESWGDKGYFYMPYEFVLNQSWCADFWIVSKVRNFEEVSRLKLWSQIIRE